MISVNVSDTVKITFYELNGVQTVGKLREENILKNLKEGNYIIDLSKERVYSLPNLNPEAMIKVEFSEEADYNFDRS